MFSLWQTGLVGGIFIIKKKKSSMQILLDKLEVLEVIHWFQCQSWAFCSYSVANFLSWWFLLYENKCWYAVFPVYFDCVGRYVLNFTHLNNPFSFTGIAVKNEICRHLVSQTVLTKYWGDHITESMRGGCVTIIWTSFMSTWITWGTLFGGNKHISGGS